MDAVLFAHLFRYAAEVMKNVLDEAGKARAFYMQLKGVDFATELAQQMKVHAESLEEQYSKLQEKVSGEANSVEAYEAIMEEVEGLQKWFENAEAGAYACGNH